MTTNKEDKVVHLSRIKDDGSLWSVEDMLEAAIELNKEEPANKAIVILLNDEGNAYNPRWLNCNLRVSEIIALCENVKVEAVVHLLGL